MSAKRKYKNLTAFLSYLKGELSTEERHALERDLEADVFEKEAMEGFERIAPEDLEEDLLSLHARMRRRLKKRRRLAIYGIAATVASILVVGTIFINIYDFNPEDDREAAPTGELLMREQAPEAGEPESVVAKEAEEEPGEILDDPLETGRVAPVEPPSEQDAVVLETDERTESEKKLKVPALMEELPVAVRENEMEPVTDAEEVVAVEAAPTRREKRAISRAKAAPSRMEEEQAALKIREQVSGVVISSEDLSPLPGASVVVQGTDSGYVTDMEGRFSFPAGQQDPTRVTASYVGMETGEYQLSPDQENRVVLHPDPATLEEVVVVAQGDQNEKYPAGAIQKVQVNQADNYSEYKGAEPVGGLQAYKIYMEKNIRFPAGDTPGKKEVVVLEFTVKSDGSLSGVQTLRSPGEAFTEEAIRLLEEGPSWNPAQGESGTADEVVRMRIVFKK